MQCPEQRVGEPVSAEDASVGERVAAGSHLPLHVASLPHPLCGASPNHLPDHPPESDAVADGAQDLAACHSTGRVPQVRRQELPGAR